MRSNLISLDSLEDQMHVVFDKEQVHNIDSVIMFFTMRLMDELSPYVNEDKG